MRRIIKSQNKYLTKEGTWDKDINKAIKIQELNYPITFPTFKKVSKRYIVHNRDTNKYVMLDSEGRYTTNTNETTDSLDKAAVFSYTDILRGFKAHPASKNYTTVYRGFNQNSKEFLESIAAIMGLTLLCIDTEDKIQEAI